MKKNNWLKRYPNYKNYFLKLSLPISLLGGVSHYFLMIRFDFENVVQMKEIFGSILFVIFMIIADYFTFYRPNRKFHVNKNE
ncbi:hypothetical protein SAMN06295967_103231 [Belliella buryatensis]|uniref:Uncharacterized protein n=1 Tax=Belliella buryatensis TaxID=1500549 RepID=A0A239BTQ9_9BACT|nr:hypothetical protein SAMN06295967_103231 [Belliella buryatensis]